MHFLEIFGQKKCLFGSKAVFLGQEVHYYMVHIAYFTELNLRICNYAQKRRICRENCKCALDENFHGHFCPWWKAAKFCHPVKASIVKEDVMSVIQPHEKVFLGHKINKVQYYEVVITETTQFSCRCSTRVTSERRLLRELLLAVLSQE